MGLIWEVFIIVSQNDEYLKKILSAQVEEDSDSDHPNNDTVDAS